MKVSTPAARRFSYFTRSRSSGSSAAHRAPLLPGGTKQSSPSNIDDDDDEEDFKSSCTDRIASFIEQIFHREPPPSLPRSIQLNDVQWHQAHSFASNRVMTAKYTLWTFIPKFLFEQFMRLANFYFLVISIIQMSSVDLAPTGQYYTFIPLVAILALTGIKELVEDMKRHKQDDMTNNNLVEVLEETSVESKPWKDLRVGDIVIVRSEKYFPADLLLLSSSEPEGLCYVETSNLDGETNLKIRQGLRSTSKLQTADEIRALAGEFECEGPNHRLYTFEGTLKFPTESASVGPSQILLRGSKLKNTPWIYGLTVYTGHESKLLMNASSTPIKKSRLEKTTNKHILAIFLLLFVMALVCTVGHIIWVNKPQEHFYLREDPEERGGENFKPFVRFIVLFNTVVPISLYVSIEIVKFCQAIFINNDEAMYDEESNTPASARTSNLNEELGQIDFIFSDKTGTLTRNRMEFRKCSVAGIKYGLGLTDAAKGAAKRLGKTLPPDYPTNSDDPLWNFYDPALLDNLTQGHPTAPPFTPIFNAFGDIIYQASSPDEAALVSAAKHFGFFFNMRKPTIARIMALTVEEDYEILNVLEFSSARKRMSVICRSPQGTLKLLCKGADSVIYERLSPMQRFLDKTTAHLEEFALEGLRTLCIAMTELKEEDYQAWLKRYKVASTTLVNRNEALEAVYEEIETNLFLLGATGIEDKLQDDVPDTISDLMKAGIKIWMLTGDKKETAINIGYSCQLLKERTQILTCKAETAEGVQTWVREQLAELRTKKEEKKHSALVLDGKTLAFALESKKREVIKLAIMCEACICCRVSPSQKAQMVELVRKSLKCTTLAIGDGANDVSMIQAADVGVGIAGREGLQAARSSDYAIGQFKYLKRLLLVHGYLSYRRLAKVILYSFYKTLTLYLVSFYFSFVNGFSGQLPWDRLSNTLWNVVYTSVGVIVLGIFEQDLPPKVLMVRPEVYMSGQRNDFFKLRVFFGWFLNSIYHSLMVFLLVRYSFSEETFPGGYNEDIYIQGTVLFTCVLLTVTGKIALSTHYWTYWNHAAYFGGWVVFSLVFVVCGFAFIQFYSDAQALFGEAPMLLKSLKFYLVTLIIPVSCLLRDFVWIFVKRVYFPEVYHTIQDELRDGKLNLDSEMGDPKESEDDNQGTKRSGYGFSQAEGETGGSTDVVSPGKLIRIYDTTQPKPEGT